MNVFELIKEKLEEKIEEAVISYFSHEEIKDVIEAYEAISIVDEVAQEYKPYSFSDKMFMLESELVENSDIENLNKLIELQNLLKYFEESLCGTYNNGWIPCSERVPSDCAIHEVTAKFSNGKSYTEFAYYDESKEEWWKFDDDGTLNVIAWKEGSEPYKEGGMK